MSERAGAGIDAWRSRVTWVALAVAVALGLGNLPMPFFGDQGMFTLGGMEMAQGSRLYLDFWDFKQPGIFLFFRGAGALFGFDEVGVHLAELLWLTAWTVAALRLLRLRWERSWGGAAFVALSLGAYVLAAQTRHLTQLEILVSPVLLVGVLLLRRSLAASPPSIRLALAAGLCGGVATIAKVLYAPLILLPVIVEVVATRKVPWRVAGAAAAGIVVPFGAVVAWHVRQGAASEIAYSWIEYPGRLIREIDSTVTLDRLVEMVEGSVGFLAPLALAATVGVVLRLRARRVERADVDLVVLSVVVGLSLLTQFWSDYHSLALYAPLAVLAVDGLVELADAAARGARRGAAAAALLLLVTALPTLADGAYKGWHLAGNGFALTNDDRRNFQGEMATTYPGLVDAAAVLADVGDDGDVFVLGDPTVLVLARRTQALRLNGWSPQDYLDDDWEELVAALGGEAAPRFVFVQDGFDDTFTTSGRGFAAALADRYEVEREVAIGTLYERRP